MKEPAFDSRDYYTDPSLLADPFADYEHMRAKGPVQRLPGRDNVVAVTGFEEALAVYQDQEHFSTINNLGGPLIPIPLPAEPSGDITAYIDAARPNVPMGNQLVTFDNLEHSRIRSLLTRLFNPSRLKANEIYLRTLSEQLIDTFADRGTCEILTDYGNVFAGMVIADLLGVPTEGRAWSPKNLTTRHRWAPSRWPIRSLSSTINSPNISPIAAARHAATC